MSPRALISRALEASADWWTAKAEGNITAQRNAARRITRAVKALDPVAPNHVLVGIRALGRAIAEGKRHE